MRLLYEALTLTGAGVALAAGGAAGVGAPPHAVRRRLATSPAERARCIFTPFAPAQIAHDSTSPWPATPRRRTPVSTRCAAGPRHGSGARRLRRPGAGDS